MADTEYISKESALACFSDWIDRYGHEHTADEMVEYQKIEELPAADVRPVVSGEWWPAKDGYYGHVMCSVCHKIESHETGFCPNCGCQMNGGRK